MTPLTGATDSGSSEVPACGAPGHRSQGHGFPEAREPSATGFATSIHPSCSVRSGLQARTAAPARRTRLEARLRRQPSPRATRGPFVALGGRGGRALLPLPQAGEGGGEVGLSRRMRRAHRTASACKPMRALRVRVAGQQRASPRTPGADRGLGCSPGATSCPLAALGESGAMGHFSHPFAGKVGGEGRLVDGLNAGGKPVDQEAVAMLAETQTLVEPMRVAAVDVA